MYSAWRRQHDCGRCVPRVPGIVLRPRPHPRERIVGECRECEGTGKDATKKVA